MFLSFVDFCRSACLRSPSAGRGLNLRRRAAGERKPKPSIAVIEALEPRLALSASASTRSIGFVDQVPGNTSTSISISVGGSQANAVNHRGDHDWYRITLTAGTRYQFNLNATANGGGLIAALGDPFLSLRNRSGAELASNDDGGGGANSQITFTATSSGTYYLDAGAYRNASTGGYTLATRSLGSADDYAASTSTSGSVAVNGSSVTGTVNSSGDSDWFRVYLSAGRTYRFDLTRGSLSDPYLRLRNGFGTQLAFDDDSGGNNNSRITYRPSSSGWFYLDASGFRSNTGSYNLRVTRTA
jgi:hypothetical protein